MSHDLRSVVSRVSHRWFRALFPDLGAELAKLGGIEPGGLLACEGGQILPFELATRRDIGEPPPNRGRALKSAGVPFEVENL